MPDTYPVKYPTYSHKDGFGEILIPEDKISDDMDVEMDLLGFMPSAFPLVGHEHNYIKIHRANDPEDDRKLVEWSTSSLVHHVICPTLYDALALVSKMAPLVTAGLVGEWMEVQEHKDSLSSSKYNRVSGRKDN
jgi:hypothetical protein